MEVKINKYHKQISCFAIIAFIISLIPVFYLCGYVHASGDDYGYGALAHSAWLDTHSVWAALKAAAQTVRQYWIGWQGTWFTIFLMALQPEVFSPNAYWIVPIVMIIINVGATSLLTEYLLVKRLDLKKGTWCLLNILMLIAMIQFFPHVKSGIFWWNGTVHYIVPWALAMLAIYGFFGFIDSKKLRYWVLSLICMFCLGGASYLAALLAPIVLVYLLLIYAREKKYSLWLLVPLAVEMAGLVVSAASPGNKARGGEDFGFSFAKVIVTIGKCFVEGILTIGEYFRDMPFVFLIFLIAAIVIWEAWSYDKPSFSFSWPGIFVTLMFCTWCAMFAPGIFSGADVSGGVPNTIMQVFVLTVLADIVYVLGWLFKKMDNAGKDISIKRFRMVAYPIVIVVTAIMIIFCKGTLKQTTFFNCVDYIVSGRADDYKAQMDERLAILLDESQKDVVLPTMNPDQGPLMHMEIMEDPEAWTNMVAQQFFRKDRIVQVKREEYYKKTEE